MPRPPKSPLQQASGADRVLGRCGDARWRLGRQIEFELFDQKLLIGIEFGVPGEDQSAAIGGGEMDVKHLDGGEFTARSYLPGHHPAVRSPRVLLMSPSREFYPSTEGLLAYYSPVIEAERVGLAVEWRRGLEVMFQLTGAPAPSLTL